ncbi:MAG: acyl-CoA/acyl-ACP dehydrogenase [SAR86 cluster bacterium]|nr:acyl-CoA/acyl-ACP dehydrogenase [SAR86 cluster bacterium]
MALVLNEEQQSLRDIAKEFLQKNAPISHFREIRDTKDPLGYDKVLWKKMAELGWAGILVSEEYGGFNFGMMGMGGILEETGKTLTPSPLFATGLLGVSLIELAGDEKQKKQLLPKIVEGNLTTAFALEEGSRHAPCNIATKAKKEGNSFVLNGEKTFVLDGHSAEKIIVAARTNGGNDQKLGITLFCIDSGTPGMEITRLSMLDSRNVAEIKLKNVNISSDCLLGELDNGFSIIEEVLDRAQIGMSAEMLGNATQAFEITLNYLKERKQFGSLIGSFQALKHRAAIMYSELELTKSSVVGALNAVDEKSNDRTRFASLAKFKAGETLHLVSNESVQMHGGVGVTDEYDIGFFMKRSRVAQQIFGSADYHIDRYATLSEY